MESNLNPGDKVIVNESDAAPFEATIRSISGNSVYLEGSSTPTWIGCVSRVTDEDTDTSEFDAMLAGLLEN